MNDKLDLSEDMFLGLWDENDPKNKPWMQRPDEKDLWYYRFRDYLLLGPERTLTEIANKWRKSKGKKSSKQSPGAWYTYKRQYEWDERASLFDKAVSEIENNIWALRQTEIMNREWGMANDLFKRFEKMLAFPLEEITRDTIQQNGKVINRTIIKPVKWSHSTMIQVAKAVSEMGRLAVGMPTEHTLQEGEQQVRFYIPSNNRETNLLEMPEIPAIMIEDKEKQNGSDDSDDTRDSATS